MDVFTPIALAAVAAASGHDARVKSTFVRACIDGELPSSEVRATVSYRELPGDIRNYLKGWESGQFYRLNHSGAYLLLMDDGRKVEEGLTRLCAVAAPRLKLRPVFDAVVYELTRVPAHDRRVFAHDLRHYNFDNQYVFSATVLALPYFFNKPFPSHYRMLQVARMTPAKTARVRQMFREADERARLEAGRGSKPRQVNM